MMHMEPLLSLKQPTTPNHPHSLLGSSQPEPSHSPTAVLLTKAILMLQERQSFFSRKPKIEDSQKYKATLQKKDKRKRNYRAIQKHCCAFHKPMLSKYLETRRMGFVKTFQIYLMIAFQRNLSRTFSLSFRTCQNGRAGLKSVVFQPHASELSSSVQVPHRSQDKCLHNTCHQEE